MANKTLQESDVARQAWIAQLTAASQQNRKKLCDVTFVVQGTKFYASKFLFGLHRYTSFPHSTSQPSHSSEQKFHNAFSEVFAQKLFEKTPSKECILEDISIEAFQFLMDYFYGLFDKAILTKHNIVDVLYACQVYRVRTPSLIPPSLSP